MEKNILFLSFYFKPDLSAGSFRNTLLADLLNDKISNENKRTKIIVITSMPNRYGSFKVEAEQEEVDDNIIIHRIDVGQHKSGLLQQATIYIRYVFKVFLIQKKYKYSTVYASSSRLMTAFLGSILAFIFNKKLYLDIRDIFRESLLDLISNKFVRSIGSFFLQLIERITFSRANIINVVTPDMVDYFKKFKKPVRCYTNGIDEIFFTSDFSNPVQNIKKIITFAGNIGKAQALDKVIPFFAKAYEDEVEIRIVGDGSGKSALLEAIKKAEINNVIFFDPVPREEVLIFYKKSDYLFLNLDDKEAFYRAMPTKLFEYSATGKTIIAGLKGFAQDFVKSNIENSIVFDSNDYKQLIEKFENYPPQIVDRGKFIEKYRRKYILEDMAEDILLLNN